MLDLSHIPLVDNHCHPLLLEQHVDVVRFRSYFSEATHASFAQTHMANTVYYLWMLRQLACFFECEPLEAEMLARRNSLSADALLERFLQAARIDTLILDLGYPAEQLCYTPERIGQLGQCRVARMLRLETLMQRLISAHADFDEVIERFSAAVSAVRAQGYCAFKSIVAYRSGLAIAEWSKDEAAQAFAQARAELAQLLRQASPDAARGPEAQWRLTQKPLIDYLLHIAFRHAAEQGLPVQFHTGYGDGDTDMRQGNPLHLRAICEREEYRTMQIVLLHESYPYCQLGAYLAAIYPHVYFDLSYAIPFVEKLEMLAFTRQALSIAPASKLMYSSDGIYIPEMHWASAQRGRSIVGQVLQEMIAAEELDVQQGYRLAQLLLHDTAYSIYKL